MSGRAVAMRDSFELTDSDARQRKVVQHLETHGYRALVEVPGAEGGAIYRHPSAPDLMVHADGRLELVHSEKASQSYILPSRPRPTVYWAGLF